MWVEVEVTTFLSAPILCGHLVIQRALWVRRHMRGADERQGGYRTKCLSLLRSTLPLPTTIMSVTSIISRAKGVAEDTRLHNVRTRHVHLTSLFKAIQSSHALLLDAVLTCFPKVFSKSVKLAISQVLKDIQYQASNQDENKVNKQYSKMSTINTQSIHHNTIPIGTIAIAAYDIQYNPIAAIFGPLVSAIAAGCPCIIFSEDNPYSSLLNKVISSSLDKEAYTVIIGSEAAFSSVYESFEKVVTYKETALSNAIRVNGLKSNLVVVDQSLVDESVYRQKGKKPSQHELRHLNNAAQVIRQAIQSSSLSSILVSENILPLFSDIVKSGSNLIISCRSTEHIISELEKRKVESNGLYIFANLKQASYLSRYTNHKCCAINCMPIELVMGYLPTSSCFGKEASSLEPLWSTSLFSQQTSTVIVPLGKIASSLSTENNLYTQLSAPAPSLPRRKARHLEFFPTGFKITAFPTLLTILGLTGYTTFKATLFVYRHASPLVRQLLHSFHI